MANNLEQKNRWIERALGVRPGNDTTPQTPAAVLARYREAKSRWQAATDAVDSQINALAKALQGSSDADLKQIANTGLMTVTGGFRTRMTAALFDIGDGDIGRLRKSATKAAGFAEKLRDMIGADTRVMACDENDFGVPVSIRDTLGPALTELAEALKAAARL